jgi:hypothetical protein
VDSIVYKVENCRSGKRERKKAESRGMHRVRGNTEVKESKSLIKHAV